MNDKRMMTLPSHQDFTQRGALMPQRRKVERKAGRKAQRAVRKAVHGRSCASRRNAGSSALNPGGSFCRRVYPGAPRFSWAWSRLYTPT
jgi:hypothetical protein